MLLILSWRTFLKHLFIIHQAFFNLSYISLEVKYFLYNPGLCWAGFMNVPSGWPFVPYYCFIVNVDLIGRIVISQKHDCFSKAVSLLLRCIGFQFETGHFIS